MTATSGAGRERRLLQLTVAVAAFVPVIAGAAGVLDGADVFGLTGDPSADSHFRYLSGLLLGIGFAFWSSIRGIEKNGSRILLLTCIVFTGGCARLAALLATGAVDAGTLFALTMELLVTPALCLWQRNLGGRIAMGPVAKP